MTNEASRARDKPEQAREAGGRPWEGSPNGDLNYKTYPIRSSVIPKAATHKIEIVANTEMSTLFNPPVR